MVLLFFVAKDQVQFSFWLAQQTGVYSCRQWNPPAGHRRLGFCKLHSAAISAQKVMFFSCGWMQLGQVEEEATFDVNLRHSSRYHKLTQWVELLLCLSLALAIGRLGIKVLTALHEENEKLNQEAMLEVVKEIVGVGDGVLLQDDGKWAVDLLNNEQLLDGAARLIEGDQREVDQSSAPNMASASREGEVVRGGRRRRWWSWT